jgi:hypothetical protein
VSTTTVEPATATAMEATTAATMEATTGIAVIATPGESASNRGPAMISTTIGHSTSITVAIARAAVAVNRPAIVSAAIAVIAAVIPGPCADEHAAEEPRRSVVPIRRAGIRIVAVIPISADGSRIAVAPIHWGANSNSNRNLSVGVSCSGYQQNTE